MKGGIAVDPDSGLEHSAHVYQDGDDKYTVVLGLTDIQSGRNSYYKLQLLESDSRNSYWLFRSWGRIGTTIGGEYLLYNTSQNALKTHVFIFFLLSPITVSFQLEIANFLKFLFTRLYPLLLLVPSPLVNDSFIPPTCPNQRKLFILFGWSLLIIKLLLKNCCY